MQRSNRLLATVITIMLMFNFLPSLASMEGTEVAHGQEDLSKLTFAELQTIYTDIATAKETYHQPSDRQKDAVLAATKAAAEQYFSSKGLSVTGWAWFEREYQYTKNWDLYTLKTHLDYKDSEDRSKHSNIYTEVYDQEGSYKVALMKSDDTIVLDNRSDYGDTVWFVQPAALKNDAAGIDLSTYTVEELDALSNKVNEEIETNHSVSKSESSIILTVTKSALEQYCLKNNIEIKSYAWYDSEYKYLRDWDYYWLETHVDYKKESSSQKTEKLFSEVCFINGNYDLVYLKMGDSVIADKRSDLITTEEEGIPHYRWKGVDSAENDQNIADSATPELTPQIIYITPEPGTEPTPQVIYITPEPQPEVTPQVIYITPEPLPEMTPEIIYVTPEPTETTGIFSINLSEASDEQLIEAADAIKGEQRARIKTHISLDPGFVDIFVGKSQKIEATIIDLPEGEKAPKLAWETSDKSIITCNNGQIKAVAGGTAVVTCSATLSDGTCIYEECKVTVKVPVNSISVDQKSLSLSVGEKISPTFIIKPENASNTELVLESSNTDVASVIANKTIEATGEGTATITATTADGSGKSINISMKVVDHRVNEEQISRLLMFAICNDVADDIFKADGNTFDKQKLHDYTYFDYVLKVIDRGIWTKIDGGNKWHVKDVLVQHLIYGGYYKYSFDISFDGKNYTMSNGWVVRASKREWLNKQDPSRYGEDDLSNLDYYIYLTVSPEQIGY